MEMGVNKMPLSCLSCMLARLTEISTDLRYGCLKGGKENLQDTLEPDSRTALSVNALWPSG